MTDNIRDNELNRVIRLTQELIGANEMDTYPIIKKELSSLVRYKSNEARADERTKLLAELESWATARYQDNNFEDIDLLNDFRAKVQEMKGEGR